MQRDLTYGNRIQLNAIVSCCFNIFFEYNEMNGEIVVPLTATLLFRNAVTSNRTPTIVKSIHYLNAVIILPFIL